MAITSHDFHCAIRLHFCHIFQMCLSAWECLHVSPHRILLGLIHLSRMMKAHHICFIILFIRFKNWTWMCFPSKNAQRCMFRVCHKARKILINLALHWKWKSIYLAGFLTTYYGSYFVVVEFAFFLLCFILLLSQICI